MRLKEIAGDLGYCLVGALASLLVMEACTRLVQWNARPMLASIRDARGNPRLPANVDMPVKLKGYDRIELATDDQGARVADASRSEGSHSGGVLVVGDSQVIGWGLPFDQSFGALVARQLGLPVEKTWLLGAAEEDPESVLGWAQDERRAHGERLRLLLVCVNLGNDFEEMYFGRAVRQMTPTGAGTQWLAKHSLLFVDMALVRHVVDDRRDDSVPLGVNLAMSSLDRDSRHVLVHATVDALVKLISALPPADEAIVVGIPQDSQIDPGEFEKYRVYYEHQSEFDKYRQMQRIALERLSLADADLSAQLAERGVRYVSLASALKASYKSSGYVDRSSHHLLAPAHKVMAAALANAIRRDGAAG
jgi:hypothetical protein